MALTGPATRRSTLRERLGLPRTRGAGPLLTAALVDSLGTGLFLPYALLYFLDTTRVPLPTIGLALSGAAALALPCSALFGPLVDRFGARSSVVLANVAQAAGFIGYLGAGCAGQIVAYGFLVNAGQNLFWTANGVMVALVAEPEDRVRWFSLLRVVRNLGTGVGALLATSVVAGAGSVGGRAVVAVNAGSFLLAAAVLARLRPGESPPGAVPADVSAHVSVDVSVDVPAAAPASPVSAVVPAQVRERRSLGVREPRRPGYREVLADRRFTALNATTVIFGLCLLGLPLILVLYVTRTLGQPTWVAGALLAGNTALIVTLQTPVTEALRPLRGTRLLRLASVLFGASFALLWAAHASGTRWIVLCLVTGVACYTAAEIIASPVLTDLVATLAPTGLRGRYFALSQICWSLAAVLGPSVFTRLMNIGTVPLWGTLLVVSVGAFVLVAGIEAAPGTSPTPTEAPPPTPAPDPSHP
ncbi:MULTISPECIES: MFS transporter [unclassified Streptomyces]|uniref:MFS transporter n=1 Tax=unclassified Streptomyces TaxID=2593676 RepID=UPI002E2CB0D9|nr:MFS transporter [Streptomyces sp. NBC_00223]